MGLPSPSSIMREARFLTAPRTRTKAISENASVPAARNTSSAIIMLPLSSKLCAERWRSAGPCQILKLTMRHMIRLPTSIQLMAIASTILVRSTFQTLP